MAAYAVAIATLVCGYAQAATEAAINAAAGRQTSVAPTATHVTPYVPTDPHAVLQAVPARRDATVRNLLALRRALDAHPHDLQGADALARAYIDFGRQLGDAHYAGYAEAVIAPWMAQPAPPPVALVLQATILQFRHQFDDARALLKQALARDPRNAQAWLTTATLDMVQGRYAAAADACANVARYGGRATGIACAGNLHIYTGQARQAMVLLGQLDTDAPDTSPGFNAWIQGLLAEACERLGDWSAAEMHYRKALIATPDDNFLQVAYADFLLDRGRPGEVLTLLANSLQSDTAYLRVALAHAALGSADTARDTWIMAARFEALTQRGSDYYGREQVRFALYLQHDPDTALALALQNWKVQRAPWDARVLLEAAKAAGRPAAAAEAIAFLAQTRLQDPVIEPLANELRASRGRTTEARR
jgi:predicted Zn-dependent protease